MSVRNRLADASPLPKGVGVGVSGPMLHRLQGSPRFCIISIKSKNDLPQIKFIKDYKPELERIQKSMDSEINTLRSSA